MEGEWLWTSVCSLSADALRHRFTMSELCARYGVRGRLALRLPSRTGFIPGASGTPVSSAQPGCRARYPHPSYRHRQSQRDEPGNASIQKLPRAFLFFHCGREPGVCQCTLA